MEERNNSEGQKYKADLKDKEKGRKDVEAKEEIKITTPVPPQEMNPQERLEGKINTDKTSGTEAAREESGDSPKGNESKAFNNTSQHPFIPQPPGFESLEEEDQNDPNPNSNPNYSYYPNVAYPSGISQEGEET